MQGKSQSSLCSSYADAVSRIARPNLQPLEKSYNVIEDSALPACPSPYLHIPLKIEKQAYASPTPPLPRLLALAPVQSTSACHAVKHFELVTRPTPESGSGGLDTRILEDSVLVSVKGTRVSNVAEDSRASRPKTKKSRLTLILQQHLLQTPPRVARPHSLHAHYLRH
jgi:hypothetical protein